MKRERTWNSNSSSLSLLVSDEEYEVADILRDLPELFFRPTTCLVSSISKCNWARKKRRSAIDHKDDDDVVNNSPTTPLSFVLSSSQSQHHQSRRKTISKNKTKEELLQMLDELTQRKQLLAKEVGVVRAYYNKILTENSTLKAAKKQLELKKSYIEKGKTKIMSKGLKRVGTDAATVSPSQQHHHLPFMYLTAQNSKVLLPSKVSDPFRCVDLNMSAAGLTNGSSAMDPSSWPHDQFELERRIGGTDHDNKCQAAEARRRRMIKIKYGRKITAQV